MAVLFALLAVAAVSGCAVGAAARLWAADHAPRVTQVLGAEVRRRGRMTRWLLARVDPAVATGLALTVALALVVFGGVVVGVLAYLARTSPGIARIDRGLAVWGASHATRISTAVLRGFTWTGSTVAVVSLTAVVGAWEWHRRPGWSGPLFLGLVVIGQSLLANLIKLAVDRARPTIDPLATFSGSSFPSGHATAAAACYAGIALLVGRSRSRRTRSVLAGAAVAIAVAVGASRILLGVHWLSDVLAGLALGWGWFALCSVAFGGRLLRFGEPAEAARPGSLNPLPTGADRDVQSCGHGRAIHRPLVRTPGVHHDA